MELLLRGRRNICLIIGHQLKMDLLLIVCTLQLLMVEQLLLRGCQLLSKLPHKWMHYQTNSPICPHHPEGVQVANSILIFLNMIG